MIVDPHMRPNASHLMRAGVCTRCSAALGSDEARAACTAKWVPPEASRPRAPAPLVAPRALEAPELAPEIKAPSRREEVQVPQPKKMVTVGDRTQTLDAWADELGVKKVALYNGRKHGKSVEDTIRELLADGAPKAEAPARSAPTGKGRRAKPVDRARAAAPTPVAAEVRTALQAIGLPELAQRLGYVVEDLGAHPRGRLMLVVD